MSDRERVEALAKAEALTRMVPYEDGKGGWLFRSATAAEVADRLRDLLAEAKADALREAADFCQPVYADALGAGQSDFADGWRQASVLILAELRDRAANPYRETSKGADDA